MEQEIRVQHMILVSAIARTLAAEGVPEFVRAVESEVMAESDLLGVPSHGVRMLPGLVSAIREGRAKGEPRLSLVRDHAAVCLLDCDNGPGRYTSVKAMNHAVERAKRFGIGICLAANTTHWGRAHAYVYRAARAGMIGICTTNAVPNMVAWGSPHPLLGNNPLAIAVPREQGEDPVVMDMAMSQAAVGKVGTYHREGKEAPPGWGLDSSGQATNDPAAILASRKILPMGDHKGAALALMMELLTSALAGGLLSFEIAHRDVTALDPYASKFFLALDVSAFVDRSHYAQRVRDMMGYLQCTAEPGQEILYPGERGWRTRDAYLQEGIPIHREIVAQLLAIGVSFPEAG